MRCGEKITVRLVGFKSVNVPYARKWHGVMLAYGLLEEGSGATAGAVPMQTDAHQLSDLLCGL